MAPPSKRSKHYNVDLVDLIRKNQQRRRALEQYDLGNSSDSDSFCSSEAADSLFPSQESIASKVVRQDAPVVDLEGVDSAPKVITSVSTVVSSNASGASAEEIANEDNEDNEDSEEDQEDDGSSSEKNSSHESLPANN